MLWLLFGTIMGIISWLVDRVNIQIPWMVFTEQYNSPLCIAAAICLFMSFKAVHIKQSKMINRLAISALPIYLVHNNNFVISGKLYEVVANIYDTQPTYFAYLILIGISLALVVGIPVLDKIRMFITVPINTYLCKFWYMIKPRLMKIF